MNVNVTKVDSTTKVNLTKGASQQSINDALALSLAYKNSAESSATSATGSANAAASSASNAALDRISSSASATAANTSALNAASSEASALSSKNSASTSASNAATSESNALTYKNAAQTAKTAAELAETNAETAETNAENAKVAAQTAQGLAESARDASVTAKNAAQTAQTAAELAETHAETAETNAETAQTASESARDLASGYATTATTQAGIATAQAVLSSGYADDASNSASASLLSANNASTSESNALGYKNDAYTYSQNASSSASNAHTSELNAAQSATDASNLVAPFTSHLSNISNPHSVTKSQIGLGSADNTADSAKPVSIAQQSALDLKANLASPTFTGTVTLPSTTSIGNVSSTEIGYLDGVTSAIQTQLGTKAPLANPAFTGSASIDGNNLTAFSGMKNRIINGGFDVWQRGTSQTTDGYGSADRWYVYSSGTTPTVSKQQGVYAGSYCLSAEGISGNTDIAFMHNIESINSKTFCNTNGTLSFWFYSSIQKSSKIAIRYPNTIDTFSSVNNVILSDITFLTGWNKYTLAIPSNSNYSKGMQISIAGYGLALTSGNIGLAQVQLEEGSVATPFENRPYGLELALCQRYYEMLIFNNETNPGTWWTSNGGVFEAVVSFNTTKRIAPTLTVVGVPQWSVNEGTYTNTANSGYTGGSTTYSFRLRAGNASIMPQVAGNIRLSGSVSASAEL